MTGDTMSAETQAFLMEAGRRVLTKPLTIERIQRAERGADGAVGTRGRQSLRRPSSTYWVTGGWVAGGWVVGGWAAGGWIAGGWAAGRWVAGRSGKADGQALSMGGTSRQRRPTKIGRA